MGKEIGYMLGIVAVGFVVNYALRALPFLLFSGARRELPSWVATLGGIVSPIIIACLIVYSYSGLAWRTPWPYLAGGATVGLQLLKRNPLISIVVGTALYMLLLNCCGCASSRMLDLDAQDPTIRMSTQGVYVGDRHVELQEVPSILEDCDIPHERVVHILLEPDVKDLRPARTLMGYLSRAGYTRPVLVTKRHSESINIGKPKKKALVSSSGAKPPANPAKRTIRYKKANE